MTIGYCHPEADVHPRVSAVTIEQVTSKGRE